MTFILTKIMNMIQIPAVQLFLISFIVATAVFLFFRLKAKMGLQTLGLLAIVAALIIYFGVFSSLLVLLVLLGSYIFAKTIFHFENNILAVIVGFFSYLQLFIILTLISNLSISFILLNLSLLLLLFIKRGEVFSLYKTAVRSSVKCITSLNIFDWWLILTSFVLSSLPQLHWDAVHANLYNAKWYVLANSFAPIQESISSLFPQNAISYYALFYKIGELRGLQLSFLFPLILSILLIKQFIQKAKLTWPLTLFFYGVLFTPIVIFQSVNGYYDLLVALLLSSSVYALLFIKQKNLVRSYLSASFLVGFAAGMKYFPLTLLLLPPIVFLTQQRKMSKRVISILLIGTLLSLAPLGIWTARAWQFTGSPVYPFFQSAFPTPELWDASDRLEQNFMIQTTLKTESWIKGGFALYPLLTYQHSSEFSESTKGYSGTMYIAAMLIQLILLVKIIIRFFQKKKLTVSEIVLVYLFFAYIAAGIITRYYRYLFPFQFVLFIVTLIVSQPYVQQFKSILKLILVLFISATLGLNFLNVVEYYRYYPPNKIQLFQPDYYYQTPDTTDPIGYLNSHASQEQTVFDASAYLLPRIHLKARAYQCTWYWINGLNKVSRALADPEKERQLLSQFTYIVMNRFSNADNNFCSQLTQNISASNEYTLRYTNDYYAIYEKNTH